MAHISRRRFFELGGFAAIAAAAAACGSNTGRGSTGDGIQQWYHAYGEKGVQEAVRQFAADYHGAKVEVQWNPGDYDSKILTALQNNSVPDVFEAQPKVDWVNAKWCVDLSELMAPVADDFLPAALASAKVNGEFYSIPQAIDMQMLFYRKSFLAQAGVKPPQSMAELVAAAKKLTGNGRKGLFVGNDGGVGCLAVPMLWSVGADALVDTDTRAHIGFDAARGAQALAPLRELNANGSLLLGSPADWSDATAFVTGQVAMQWTGLWNMPTITEKLGDDFGVLPLPKAAGGAPSVPTGAYGSMVNAKSKNIEQSKKFVQWLWVEQTDKQLEFATKFGFHIPARKSLIAKATTLRSGPAAEAAKFATDHGRVKESPLWTSTMRTTFADAATKIVKEGADGRSTLTDAVQTINDELKRLQG